MIKYYTDYHDVDEDMATIPEHGGDWSMVGIMQRYLYNNPSTLDPTVASSNMKKISNYTDAHNVDEDVTAIPYHGGYWPHGDIAGIALRDIACDSSDLFFTVASRLIYLS